MCSSNLLSGEVKLKVGNSDSDCRICFQPTLPNYCKEKHPENSKPFFFSVDLTQGANFTVSAVGKAKGLLPNQICRLCYDCVTVFANKTCIFAKSKSAGAVTFLWVLQLPNLDRTMSRLGDWPLPNTSKYNTNKLLPNTPTTSLQECVFPAFKLTVPKAYLMLAMLGYVESTLLTVELCRH